MSTEQHESFRQTKLNLPFLSHTDERLFMRYGMRHFDYGLFQQNYEILMNIDLGVLTDLQKYEARVTLERMRILYGRYKKRLPDFSNAPSIEDSLEDGFSVKHIEPWGGIRGLSLLTEEEFRREGDFVVLSNNHVTTFSILDAYRQIMQRTNPGKLPKIGVVVFDTHTDIYEQEDVDGWSKYLAPIRKANFIKHLLGDNLAAAVSIIGPTIEQKNMYEVMGVWNDRSSPTFKPTMDVYKRYKERIAIGGIDDKDLDHSKLLDMQFAQLISVFENNGVDSLYFSVDTDSLNLSLYGLTVTDYNTATPLVLLGLQDFSKTVYDVDLEFVPPDDKKKADTINSDRTLSILNGCQRVVHPSARYREISFAFGEPKCMQANSGLLLGNIDRVHGKYIDHAKRVGWNTALPLPQGRLLGDITELSGCDWGSRGARIVKHLVTTLTDGFGGHSLE